MMGLDGNGRCSHHTAIALHTHRPGHASGYQVLLCTWGCGEYLVSVDDLGSGLTRTWAVSELIAERMADGLANLARE
jgi:hypothetical protein